MAVRFCVMVQISGTILLFCTLLKKCFTNGKKYDIINSPHELNKHILNYVRYYGCSVHFCFLVKMYAPFLYASPELYLE